jgi:hypothetical protein
MSQKRIVSFIDHLDGTEAEGTVAFALDGRLYNIDLSAANSAKLRDVFAPYVGAARRAGGSTRAVRRSLQSDREQNQTIREWAQAHGMNIAARGRISGEVMEAYRKRDARPAPEPEKKPRRRSRAKAAAE